MNIDGYIKHWARLCESEEIQNDTYNVIEVKDRQQIIDLLPNVIEMIRSSYKDGYKGVLDFKRLSRTTPLLKIVTDNNNELLACVIYMAVKGSYKATGASQNKTDEGKKALQEIIKSDINPYTNWCWCEASGPIERWFKKFNGYPLPNEHAVMVLEKPSEKIELDADGFYYKRIIGQSENEEPDRKVIFGFRDAKITAEVIGNVDYEIRRNYFNNDLLKESGDELKDFHYAVSFVDQLSDLYDEEGLRDLTPGLAKDLDLAIKTLEKYKHHKDWVQYTLDNALNLKELMPEIKII